MIAINSLECLFFAGRLINIDVPFLALASEWSTMATAFYVTVSPPVWRREPKLQRLHSQMKPFFFLNQDFSGRSNTAIEGYSYLNLNFLVSRFLKTAKLGEGHFEEV